MIMQNFNNINNNINPFSDDNNLINNKYYERLPDSISQDSLDLLINNYILGEKSKELHAPFHHFLGPGTHIITRLNKKIMPINRADASALIHDVEYLNPYISEKAADVTALSNAGGGNSALQKLMWIGFTLKDLAGGYNAKKDFKQYQLATYLVAKNYKDIIDKYNLKTTPFTIYDNIKDQEDDNYK